MTKPLRVLIIEDSDQDGELLRLELKRAGYKADARQVTELADVRTALERPWDVVLSDFQLGKFTAIDALDVAREVGADVPFIIVSGSVGEEVAVSAMRAGARDYFRKERLERLGPAIERELSESDARRQLRAAEARTRAVEQRLHDTVNAAPIPIAVVEGPEYVYTFRNAAHVGLFGGADSLGRPRLETFPEYAAHQELFDRVYRTGAVVESRGLRVTVPQRDGVPAREVVLNAVLVPLRDASDGPATGVTVIAVDVTREFELRHRSEQARREAENANRVKDEFLATLSHELRTPLNAILGWTLMLRGGGLSAEKGARALDTIEKSAREQTRLIEDLLDVSRIVNGKLTVRPRAVDLGRLLDASLDSVRFAATAKNIELTREPAARGGPVFGDPDRLQQVLWNLLSNAIKFTPAGGRVVVRIAREEASVVLTVADTGIGIDPLFLPHLFERFRQADSSTTRGYGGLGIGLAIAKQITELHGGTLRADSPGSGKGTTFTLSLPARMAIAETPAEALAEPVPSLEGLSILVVEDDPDAREIVSMALEASGAIVRSGGSSLEAIGLLRDWSPDVLVSDIGLPDEDGYALVKRVREIMRSRPRPLAAIALTAYASDDDVRTAILSGFQLHVAKPIEPDRLIRLVAGLKPPAREPAEASGA